tara:strand:- start:874 stop:1512 length:639 start_codon:yes stop_codon:yes gene_type:complete
VYYITSKKSIITKKLKVNIIRLDIAKMTYEPTNADLYNVIQRLCFKIENLENKINFLSEKRETNIEKIRRKNGLETPDIYSNWLSFIKVEKKHYDDLFTINGSIITTFKNIILEHMNVTDDVPLYKFKRSIYVYQTIDDQPEWCLFDNDNLIKMVREVWRKLLAVQLETICDDKDDDEVKDQKRRVVIHMRQNLSDKKCNRDSIMKWMKEIL